jgi:hypothetical protein
LQLIRIIFPEIIVQIRKLFRALVPLLLTAQTAVSPAPENTPDPDAVIYASTAADGSVAGCIVINKDDAVARERLVAILPSTGNVREDDLLKKDPDAILHKAFGSSGDTRVSVLQQGLKIIVNWQHKIGLEKYNFLRGVTEAGPLSADDQKEFYNWKVDAESACNFLPGRFSVIQAAAASVNDVEKAKGDIENTISNVESSIIVTTMPEDSKGRDENNSLPSAVTVPKRHRAIGVVRPKVALAQ